MGRSSYGTDLLWRSIRYGWFGTVVLSSALLAKDYVVDAYSVTGSSMAPTLSPNSDTANEEDFVVISKLRFGGRVNNDGLERLSPGWDRIRASSLWRLNCNELRRGDIVTFWSPVSPNIGIKRVIALEGDTVIPEWRVKHGKGFRMVSPGAKNEGHALGGRPESLVVPYGHIWVEGDNRYDSQDSRDYGPISRGLVEGKAMAIVFPFGRMRVLSRERPTYKTGTVVKPGVATLPPDFIE